MITSPGTNSAAILKDEVRKTKAAKSDLINVSKRTSAPYTFRTKVAKREELRRIKLLNRENNHSQNGAS